jgi:hypothetical protein
MAKKHFLYSFYFLFVHPLVRKAIMRIIKNFVILRIRLIAAITLLEQDECLLRVQAH